MTETERKKWAEGLQVGDVALEKYSNHRGKGKQVQILGRREVERGCESGVWLKAAISERYGTFTQEIDSHWFYPIGVTIEDEEETWKITEQSKPSQK